MALCGTLQRFQHEPAQMDALADQLYRTQWVVYAKPPFGGPAAVVKYLGRYTHRIALSDSRIVALTDTHVSFAWKDCADHNRSKIMTHAGIFPQKSHKPKPTRLCPQLYSLLTRETCRYNAHSARS